MNIEIHDRYSALGIPRPDPKNTCDGQCEGTGYFPENDQTNPLWQEAHAKPHKEMEVEKSCEYHSSTEHFEESRLNCLSCVLKCDGWHFIKCPDCNGTGRKDGSSVWEGKTELKAE